MVLRSFVDHLVGVLQGDVLDDGDIEFLLSLRDCSLADPKKCEQPPSVIYLS